MIVGGYSLHLYCDDPLHQERHPHQVTSIDADIAERNETACLRVARIRGWRFRQGKCFCPDCVRASGQPSTA